MMSLGRAVIFFSPFIHMEHGEEKKIQRNVRAQRFLNLGLWLSLTPGTQMVEGENRLPNVVL